MLSYEDEVLRELRAWQRKMEKRPSLIGRTTKGLQNKVNNLIPDKVHEVMTTTIKGMVNAVLTGSKYITGDPLRGGHSLEDREKLVAERLSFYKKAAAVEGAGTGAGGILLGLTDFPLLISLKIKLLYDVASIYGFDVRDYRERLFILCLFQLAFSSENRRPKVYAEIINWEKKVQHLSPNLQEVDWRTFQQEYRDYIDLSKMFQMLPGIGAPVGAYVNYKLLDKLGVTAKNGYRLRLLKEKI